MTLAVCVLANNNPEELARTLASITGDEAFVVDLSGKDKTKPVADQHNAQFFSYSLPDDIEGAMSESLRYASTEWLLFLNAGEVLSEADAAKVHELVKRGDAYTFAVDGEKVVRLFRNFAAIHFQDDPPRVEPVLKRLEAEIADAGITV